MTLIAILALLWGFAKIGIKLVLKTVQIEIGFSEYGGNKKAVQTDGHLAKHQNWENAKTIIFHHDTLKEGGAR